MSERTLVLVKPDGVERGMVGEVIGRIERKGLKLVALELRQVGEELAKQNHAAWVETSAKANTNVCTLSPLPV